MEFNIVKLIDSNELTEFSKGYQTKLINKLKENFNETEQRFFFAHFYGYTKYKNNEFVVSTRDVWKWLGFSREDECKKCVKKNFKENEDYVIEKSAPSVERALLNEKVQNSRQNKQYITLTTKCFKKLCMKAKTKKSDEIHEYYIKLQDIMYELLEEEYKLSKKQLESIEETS